MDNNTGRLWFARIWAKVFLQGGICALLIFLALSCGQTATAIEDPLLGIRIDEETPWDGIHSTYLPITLIITNHGEERYLEAVAISENGGIDITTTKTIALPPGITRLELPVLRSPSYGTGIDFIFYVNGRNAKNLAFSNSYSNTSEDIAGVIFIGRGRKILEEAIEEEQRQNAEKAGHSQREIRIVNLPPERACNNWQSYAGLNGMVMLENDSLRHLNAAQREALSTWVRHGGGTLGLVGPGAEETMQRLRLPRKRARATDSLALKYQPCGLGRIIFWDDVADLEKVKANELKSKIAWKTNTINNMLNAGCGITSPGYFRSYRTFNTWDTTPVVLRNLLKNLMRIPVMAYCAIAIILTLIIGPLNLILLRRRKKLIMFYFTAPALAFVGMVLLGCYSVVSEGLGIKSNEIAVLLHDPVLGDGAIYQAKGIYAAFSPKRLEYPPQTVAVAFWRGSREGTTLSSDWTNGNTLESGFVRSRTPSGIFTVTPERVRMGITITTDSDGNVYAENGLTGTAYHTIARIYTSEGEVQYYQTERHIAAGLKAKMTYIPQVMVNEVLFPVIEEFMPFFDNDRVDWQVLAQVSTLPYMEAGGLDKVRILNGKYYYIALNSEVE